MALWIMDFISGCFFKLLIILDAIVFHAYVCYANGRKLVSFLIRGTKTWVIMALRLMLFTVMLTPGWFTLMRYWLLSPLILRNLRYGKGAKNRNLLDVYLPVPQKKDSRYSNKSSRKSGAPVVIFVSGGAWTIGYKLWSALVARGLARLGILTIVPDYRNFPQGDIEDMMQDISLAVEWTTQNAHRFGGDADKIVLSGQSAGAHITLCLLVADYLRTQEQAQEQSAEGLMRTPADCFLDDELDSDSDIGDEEDVGSEYSDDEHLLSPPPAVAHASVAAPPASLSLEHPTLVDVKQALEGARATAADPSPPSSTANSAEFYTPLRDTGSRSQSYPFSPDMSAHGEAGLMRSRSRNRSRSSGTGSPPNSRRSSKTAPALLELPAAEARSLDGEDPDPQNTSGMSGGSGAATGRRTSRSASSAPLRHRSRSFGLYGRREHEPSSMSILDMFDSLLDANISASRDTDSTGQKILGSAASSIRREFHNQLKRNSRIGGADFDVPGKVYVAGPSDTAEESSDDVRTPPPAVTPRSAVPDVAGAAPGPNEDEPESPHSGGNPEDVNSPWREVPSVQKPPSAASMGFMSPFSPPPAVMGAATGAYTPAVRDDDALPEPSSTVPLPLPVPAGWGASSRRMSPRGARSRAATRAHRRKRVKNRFNIFQHVKLFIGVSGPYNLAALVSHIHKRGLDISILNNICRGDIASYSPTTRLAEFAELRTKSSKTRSHTMSDVTTEESPHSPYTAYHPSSALQDLTPIALFHGSRDASIPVSICTELSDLLETHGANVLCKIYEGWSHTDAILEAPLSGTMRLFHDMAGVIFAHTADSSSAPGTASISAASSVDRLVLPEPADAGEVDKYSCSMLDYISLFLFPKLFGGSGTSAVPHTTKPGQKASGEDPGVVVASTDGHVASEDSSVPSHSAARHALKGTSRHSHSARRLKKKTKAAGSAKQGSGRGSAPMVSQLLVKVAREINPF